MYNVSIYSPQSEVMKKLLNYLQSRRYKIIGVNHTENKITAEFRHSFFKKFNFLFKIIPVNPSVTNIEIRVNPEHAEPTSSDLEKENALAERIYYFF